MEKEEAENNGLRVRRTSTVKISVVLYSIHPVVEFGSGVVRGRIGTACLLLGDQGAGARDETYACTNSILYFAYIPCTSCLCEPESDRGSSASAGPINERRANLLYCTVL